VRVKVAVGVFVFGGVCVSVGGRVGDGVLVAVMAAVLVAVGVEVGAPVTLAVGLGDGPMGEAVPAGSVAVEDAVSVLVGTGV
jgi:hypothetical protein